MLWGTLCRETLRVNFLHWGWLAPIKGVEWGRSTVLGLLTGALISRPIGEIYFGLCEQDYDQIKGDVAWVCAVFGFLFWVIFTPVRIDWLSRIGRWTYSTYLLHWGVMILALRAANLFFIRNLNSAPMLFTTIVVVASFAAGAVFYRWIEQPSDRVGKWFTRGKR